MQSAPLPAKVGINGVERDLGGGGACQIWAGGGRMKPNGETRGFNQTRLADVPPAGCVSPTLSSFFSAHANFSSYHRAIQILFVAFKGSTLSTPPRPQREADWLSVRCRFTRSRGSKASRQRWACASLGCNHAGCVPSACLRDEMTDQRRRPETNASTRSSSPSPPLLCTHH